MACIDYVFVRNRRFATSRRRFAEQDERKALHERALLQRGDHNLFGLGIGRLRVATGPSP